MKLIVCRRLNPCNAGAQNQWQYPDSLPCRHRLHDAPDMSCSQGERKVPPLWTREHLEPQVRLSDPLANVDASTQTGIATCGSAVTHKLSAPYSRHCLSPKFEVPAS